MTNEHSSIPALLCDQVRNGVLRLNSSKDGKLVFRTSRIEKCVYGVIEIEYADGMTVEVDVGAPDDKLKDKVWSLNANIFIEADIGNTIKTRCIMTLPNGEREKSDALEFVVEE